jgi:hypothetical protein
VRTSGINERGFSDTIPDNRQFKGIPATFYHRVQFTLRNSWQFGITAENDAGEPFKVSNNYYGYDFLSFYTYYKPSDNLKVLIGDYLVQIGQGLSCYNGFALGKNADVINIIRNPQGIKPYRSGNENIFNRGLAVEYVYKKKIHFLGFGSYKKMDAMLYQSADTTSNAFFFTGLNTSGYHRNENELQNRKSLSMATFGADVSYNYNNIKIGWNAIGGFFGNELIQNPYYSSTSTFDDTFFNTSIYTDFCIRNIRLFGEYALDRNFNTAILQGMTIILHPKLELTFSYRNFDKKYFAPLANSFSEGVLPSNEKGLYSGLRYYITTKSLLSGYLDLFQYPAPKYRIIEPSQNMDYWAEWKYQPKKDRYFYIRFRTNIRNRNYDFDNQITALKPLQRNVLRLHYQQPVSDLLSLGGRVELSTFYYDNNLTNGYVFYQDVNYQPNKRNKSRYISLRLLYYDVPKYENRLFVTEKDVMYQYNAQFYFGRGLRTYIVNYHTIKRLVIQYKIGYNYFLQKSPQNPYSLTQNNLYYNAEATLQCVYKW